MSEGLVLVPDMMCDARIFMPQILELTKRHAVQIACVSQADTIQKMAEGLLENAPGRFALAGLGLGGQVAMEVVRRAPDRVVRVALISTTAQIESPTQAAEREPQIVRARAGKLPDVVREILPENALSDGPIRPQILDLMQDMAAKLGPEVFQRQSHAMQQRPDQQKTLRTTKVSALVIGGGQNQMIPPARHEFLAGMLPNAVLSVIPQAGHFPTIETPAQVNEMLSDWMKGPLVLT